MADQEKWSLRGIRSNSARAEARPREERASAARRVLWEHTSGLGREERRASASGSVAGWEESRWRMRLERSVEGGRSEAAAAARARAAGAWEASARRSGRRRSMASWSCDAVVTDTEKEGRFKRCEAGYRACPAAVRRTGL